MKWSDIFPMEVTFFSVLYYIFMFYLLAYVIFHIYIYTNGLNYEINCKNNDKCIKIYKKNEPE